MARLPAVPQEPVPGGLVRWRTTRPELARAVRLEDPGPGPAARWIVAVIVLALLLGLSWAATTRVPEVVTAPGTVLPAADVARIVAPKAGLLAELDAVPGRIVEADAPLARIVPDGPPAELAQTRAELVAREGDAAALVARIEAGADDAEASETGEAAVAAERRRVAEAETALALFETEAATLAEQEVLVTAQVVERTDQAVKGLIAQSLLLETQRELSRIRGRRTELVQRIAATRQAIAAAAASVVAMEARVATAATSARRAVQDELARVTAEVEALRARVAEIEGTATVVALTAPARGLVRSVAGPAGRRIDAGSVIAEIVPLDAAARAEVRIPVADFAGVYVGQAVAVRVAAYDRPGAPTVPGVIERVSPLAFDAGPGSDPYYSARVLLLRAHAGDDPARDLIVAGMAVTCEIALGERTLLNRLLSPTGF